jgi:transketolase
MALFQKKEIELFANDIRRETLKEIACLGVGHTGGTLSVAEVLAVLYGAVMKYDPHNPNWSERDRFVLSKGHAGPALYAILAMKGFIPMEWLETLNQPGTNLPSHCDRQKTPGIDSTTGSLGQGLSVAAGIAMGIRMNQKDSYTYVICGDGECNEGQIWEAALLAANQKLDRLIAYIDYNKQMLDGFTKDVCDLGDLQQKFSDFGWFSQEVDGHDVAAIWEATNKAKSQQGQPAMIVLHTVKGKGISLYEGIDNNHNVNISEEDLALCLRELALEKKQIQEAYANGTV